MENLLTRPAPIAPQSRTIRFEGAEHGSGISFFSVDYDPGQGTRLHVHPYTETWIVRAGVAEFTVGTSTTRARAGDVVVGPARIPHKFRNVGSGRLETICVHASEKILQDWVEEPSA